MYSETAVDESLRKVTKKEILDLVERLDQIVDSELAHVPEIVHLNLALKCLQLPVLEKKLIGGTLLILKVL
jgi:hypothetical protein